MRRNRIFCGACEARKSSVTMVGKTPKAKCLACGAEIALVKTEYGKWIVKPLDKVV